MLTEQELLDNGSHVRCKCNNVFSINKSYCPFCNALNLAVKSGCCPTCGQTFPAKIE